MVCVLKDITQRTSIMSDIVTHCGCWTLIRFGTWYIYNTVAFLEEIRFICSTYTWWSRDEIKQRNICGWDYQDAEYIVPLFPMAQWVNSPSAVQETWETRIWSLGQKIPWRRKWQLTSLFSPEKSCGQRSLAVYGPKDDKVRHDWMMVQACTMNEWSHWRFLQVRILDFWIQCILLRWCKLLCSHKGIIKSRSDEQTDKFPLLGSVRTELRGGVD